MARPRSRSARSAVFSIVLVITTAARPARAQDEEEEQQEAHAHAPKKEAHASSATASLALKLQNPIANLVSVLLQSNFDSGPHGVFGYTLDIQPAIPITLNPDWLLISRTILPIVDQGEIQAGTGRQFGLGDLTESVFWSPSQSKAPMWGFGPVLLLPTATSDRLGASKWGAGPTAVLLFQEHGVTAGLLANHIWSFAGDGDRPNVNATFLQPFLSYTFSMALSVTLQTETTYDWKAEQWTVPLALGASQVVKIGRLPISVGLFGRWWVARPDTAPHWGVRVPVTLLFPD